MRKSLILALFSLITAAVYAQLGAPLGVLPRELKATDGTDVPFKEGDTYRSIRLMVDPVSGRAVALRKVSTNLICFYTFDQQYKPNGYRLVDLGELDINSVSILDVYFHNDRLYAYASLNKAPNILTNKSKVFLGVFEYGLTDGESHFYPLNLPESTTDRLIWTTFTHNKRFYVLTRLFKPKQIEVIAFNGREQSEYMSIGLSENVDLKSPNALGRVSFLGSRAWAEFGNTPKVLLSAHQDSFYLYPAKSPVNRTESSVWLLKWSAKLDTSYSQRALLGNFSFKPKPRLFAIADSLIYNAYFEANRLIIGVASIKAPEQTLATIEVNESDPQVSQLKLFETSTVAIFGTSFREKKYQSPFRKFSLAGPDAMIMMPDSSGLPLLCFAGTFPINYGEVTQSFSLRLDATGLALHPRAPIGPRPFFLNYVKHQWSNLPTEIGSVGSDIERLPNGEWLVVSYDWAQRGYVVYRARYR